MDTEEEILKTYDRLIKGVIREHKGKALYIAYTLQYEDLYQVAQTALIKAYRSYDGSLGATFATYASIRVRGAILDEVRRWEHGSRNLDIPRRLESFDAAVHDLLEKDSSEDAVVVEHIGKALEQLPLVERLVVRLRLCGLTNVESADLLDLSYGRIHQLMASAVSNIKVILGEDM